MSGWETLMAILAVTRRRVLGVEREARRMGVQDALFALRGFAEIDPDNAPTLLRAAAAIEQVHVAR